MMIDTDLNVLKRNRFPNDIVVEENDNTLKRFCATHSNDTENDEEMTTLNIRPQTGSLNDVNISAGCCTNQNDAMPSADEILVQMVQNGCYTHEQVVDFCISSGIPLSRMLRMDLLRIPSQKK